MASRRPFIEDDIGRVEDIALPEQARAPLRVLLVDHDEQPRLKLGSQLRGLGCTVDIADDADEALGFMCRFRYDLVLADVRLKGTGGLSLLATTRVRHPAIPVVLLAPEIDVDLAVRGYRLGAADLLEKPVAGDVLEASIVKVLGFAPLHASLLSPPDRMA